VHASHEFIAWNHHSPSFGASLWNSLLHTNLSLHPTELHALPPDPPLITLLADNLTLQVLAASPNPLQAFNHSSVVAMFYVCDSIAQLPSFHVHPGHTAVLARV
jgi:hypothetical protein